MKEKSLREFSDEELLMEYDDISKRRNLGSSNPEEFQFIGEGRYWNIRTELLDRLQGSRAACRQIEVMKRKPIQPLSKGVTLQTTAVRTIIPK